MLKVEKITLLVSSDTGNQAFDRIISMVQEGELMGEYKLINYENPTEYTLIQSKHKN